MKKHLAIASVAALMFAALAAQLRGQMDENAGKNEKETPVTIAGTVVDLHCYVTHGIHDAAHTGCANACIARGIPAGFLADDGTLYLLFEKKPFSVKEKVAGLADVPVILKGNLSVRNGVKGIQITSIERKNPA